MRTAGCWTNAMRTDARRCVQMLTEVLNQALTDVPHQAEDVARRDDRRKDGGDDEGEGRGRGCEDEGRQKTRGRKAPTETSRRTRNDPRRFWASWTSEVSSYRGCWTGSTHRDLMVDLGLSTPAVVPDGAEVLLGQEELVLGRTVGSVVQAGLEQKVRQTGRKGGSRTSTVNVLSGSTTEGQMEDFEAEKRRKEERTGNEGVDTHREAGRSRRKGDVCALDCDPNRVDMSGSPAPTVRYVPSSPCKVTADE